MNANEETKGKTNQKMSAEEGALLGCAFKAAKELLNWTRALWLSDVSERVKCDSVRKRSVLLRKHKCFAERRRTRHELAELSPAEDGGVPSAAFSSHDQIILYPV